MSPGNRLSSLWQSYKYRFVPWLALNLKNRTVRRVEGSSTDKIIPDEEALRQVTRLTRALVATFSSPVGDRHLQEGVAVQDLELLIKLQKQNYNKHFNYGKISGHSITEKQRESGLYSNESSTDMKGDALNTKALNNYDQTNIQDKEKFFTENKSPLKNKSGKTGLDVSDDNAPETREFVYSRIDHRVSGKLRSIAKEILKANKSDEEYGEGGEYGRPDAYERCLVPPSASQQLHAQALQLQEDVLGHRVERCMSAVGGTGVRLTRVTEGGYTLPAGRVVALYPGTLYLPQQQAVMLQSFANPFMLRCIDGLLLDGNDRFLSRILFRSCVGRSQVGPSPLADVTWMTDYPSNPLNVGQYVNNQSKAHPSNVAYQELTAGASVALEERAYLPNIWYGEDTDGLYSDSPLRLVALVTTRPVQQGEELFSDYFTIVT